jgi:O-antigen/teichoic acid export membrane protein
MRRHIVPLFAANLLAFGSVGVSYLVYSRLLTAAQFGAYAAALAVGTLSVLVLDGGVRTSIIKHEMALTVDDESSLLILMMGFSVFLLAALYAGQSLLMHFYPAVRDQIVFVASFAAVFLFTYPWIGLATASLERQLQYSKLAWTETVAIILERGAPALFLMFTKLGLGSFVIGLVLGRLTRLVLLGRLHRVRWAWRVRGDGNMIRRLLSEGFAFQVGGAASLIRDNAHILLVGPLFGALWVGYYAWGFQLCTIASQAFVQISARVSLPVTAQASNFANRWPTITTQIALLTAATAPILAAVLLMTPTLNHQVFSDKWSVALTMLPLFCARMIAGIAITPVGILLLVEKGAKKFAGALWVWTAIELLSAYVALKVLGPTGMALSYAVTVWVGILVILKFFGDLSVYKFREICSIIIRRPAIWVFALASATYHYQRAAFNEFLPTSIVVFGIALSLGTLLVDPIVRSSLRRS